MSWSNLLLLLFLIISRKVKAAQRGCRILKENEHNKIEKFYLKSLKYKEGRKKKQFKNMGLSFKQINISKCTFYHLEKDTFSAGQW